MRLTPGIITASEARVYPSGALLRVNSLLCLQILNHAEAVFLVVCDPSMNELLAIYTVLCIDLYGSRSLIEGSHTTKNTASGKAFQGLTF